MTKQKFLIFSVLISLSALSPFLQSCKDGSSKSTVNNSDYTEFVNVFIGTGGHGHTFPGATVPNGMVQLSPDTRRYGWDACSGYHYSDSTINGFCHTHLSGTGCADYGDILFMPSTGEQKIAGDDKKSQRLPYASRFSHANEKAHPGYYSVFLEDYGVKAEVTTTDRTGFHRYTFPASETSGIIVDLDYSIENQKTTALKLEIVNDTTIRGMKTTDYWAFGQRVYFYARFSKPFSAKLAIENKLTDLASIQEGSSGKALLQFKTEKDEPVLVKVGLSSVDFEGAEKNMEAELPDWNFDRTVENAKEKWNNVLSAIQIEGATDDQKKIFYTAMYHASVSPYLLSDTDNRYLGMDGKIHETQAGKPMYTVFSLWDTFRALHPYLTIVNPSLNEVFIQSLINKSKEGGVLPMWELGSSDTGCMIGYHAVSVITDAYMKGYRNFDVNEAYKACIRIAEYDTTGIIAHPVVIRSCQMPPAKYYKNTLGYIPCDKDNEAVAKALEYAYNDWCIAQMAKAMNDDANYNKYRDFSEAYKKYYDASTGFMRGLDSQMKWRTPFEPRSSSHRNDDYCEGTAWQWLWFVPHDIDGLAGLMGGKETFIVKLDSLFTASSELVGSETSSDISGLIGQYAHGNEPGHHTIHLYNYVNQPWKAQEKIDQVLQTLYFNNENGLAGNEDCGQMSAWYILNALGFYQVCPGNPVYSIGRPLFEKATIRLPEGKTFVVEAKNNSAANKYVQSMELNGKKLETPFFTHEELAKGGKLTLVMGNQPKK